MKSYRPLLLQELDVRLPGIHLRRLRLNRHLPDVDLVAEHSHGFTQLLCYLSGAGLMTIEGADFEINPSSVVFLPPHRSHSFRETTGRRPLCLVLDLDWRGAVKHGVSLARMNASVASQIKHELSELTRLPDPGHVNCRLTVAAIVLRILDALLRTVGGVATQPRQMPAFVRQYERILRSAHTPLPEIKSVAEQMGYQVDYLNRVFKQATGQTLREYRDALVLTKASRLLREKIMVKDVCQELGFLDQNYFARWFKRQTGRQPRAYSRSY